MAETSRLRDFMARESDKRKREDEEERSKRESTLVMLAAAGWYFCCQNEELVAWLDSLDPHDKQDFLDGKYGGGRRKPLKPEDRWFVRKGRELYSREFAALFRMRCGRHAKRFDQTACAAEGR